MCERAQKYFFSPGSSIDLHHCRDIPHGYFWFLYILCSVLLYKELPPPLRLFFFFFALFFLTSFLQPSGCFPCGRIIWNPLGKALISPSSFRSRIGLRKGCLGTSVYIFPWIGFTKPVDIFSFATAVLERFTNTEYADEQMCLEPGQCWCWNTKFLSGGSILVRRSSFSTCSKDGPLILPARQTERD